jgi:UDP-N-acetylmuramate dehydrogenase
MEIFSNHPLFKFNTFGIDVRAKEFVDVEKEDDLMHIISSNLDKTKKLLILGGGSNVLFTGDFDGLVIRVCTKGKEIIKEDEDEVQLRVAAGEDWDGLVEYCVKNGWAGLENLSGIPGLAGSSPIQNIGAYGTELKDQFVSLEALNLCTGERVQFDPERCQFGYRDSIFKRALKGRVVITHVVFSLKKNPVFNLSYQALKQKLAHIPEKEISLQNIREAVLEIRASKLPDPKVIGNAGSFFKNPVISHSALEQLKERYPGIVYYSAPDLTPWPPVPRFRGDLLERGNRGTGGEGGEVKLAAGWLIEQCGWKGFRKGDAGVHKDQALVLVNYGNATGREILDLAGKIQQSVREKFGVELEREVNVIS